MEANKSFRVCASSILGYIFGSLIDDTVSVLLTLTKTGLKDIPMVVVGVLVVA